MADEKPKPEIRLDQLTGLRTILSPARADRPFDFGGLATEPDSEARPRTAPSARGARTAPRPRPGRIARAGASPTRPGWRVRAVPNLYPALAQTWEDDARARPQADRGRRGRTAAGDPLRATSRGREPDLFRASVATGFHEVIVNSPKHRTSLGQLDDAELAAAVAGWRERMRAYAERAAYVQLIVNEGREAGASLEHSHAQLYALGFVPAAVARERERFSSYNQHTMGGDLLAEIASEEVRRRERLVAIDDDALLICPWASRSPFELRIIPRTAAPSFERGRRGGAGDAAHRAAGARGPLRRRSRSSTPGRSTAPARRRDLPLAPRHRAADRRSAPASRCRPASSSTSSPRAGGGGAARGAWVGSPARAARPPPIPRFIADASVEGLPYGRWGQRLRDEFAKACEPHVAEAGGPPGEVTWFPERAWGGRVYVPAVAPVEGAAEPSEYFGFVSFVRPAEDEAGEAGGFEARADFTDVTADQNPDWMIDLNEEVIGTWRGEEDRRGDVTLVWGTPLIPGAKAATAELEAEVVDQTPVSDERFTLIALDAVKGFPDELYLEVKIWSNQGQQLAAESLYEEPE